MVQFSSGPEQNQETQKEMKELDTAFCQTCYGQCEQIERSQKKNKKFQTSTPPCCFPLLAAVSGQLL